MEYVIKLLEEKVSESEHYLQNIKIIKGHNVETEDLDIRLRREAMIHEQTIKQCYEAMKILCSNASAGN